ncbi:MAG: S8 family peptidase [Oscillospiraceae bacterium]|nr:S8 family peptidase [Oscillospiraceae bacterium]
MNNLLKLKLKFTPEKGSANVPKRTFTTNRFTDSKKIENLIKNLKEVKAYYSSSGKLVSGFLIDAYYDDIIAKSSRIRELLKDKQPVDKSIVGARFSDAEKGEENHIITYYVTEEALDKTISKLEIIYHYLVTFFDGKADKKNFNETIPKINFSALPFKECFFRDVIVDCSVIERFDVPKIAQAELKESMLITFYKTELSVQEILNKTGLENIRYSFYGDTTLSVDSSTFSIIRERIPYLISMVASDISTMEPIAKKEDKVKEDINIPLPKEEPIIGVIDTLFDQSVYFSNWVEYEEVLDYFEKSSIKAEDYDHGTEVTSIIVDGPTLNPELDDGCGRFRVKHFGVCTDKISPARLIRKIEKIIDENPQIHVWNLSLGTEEEVSKNFISFDAAILDKLQATKNIIFVVAGTNNNYPTAEKFLRIGSPADSLNSLVVNSVKRDNTPCSYSRIGQVLSFFKKPDVSYYGGDIKEKINVYSTCGKVKEMGTSFSAPWISRKMCYLIDVMGLPREVAKALIIDSAAGWEFKQGAYKNQNLIGFGVVPIRIEEILSSENSEIKFVLYETAKAYKTSNYAIPVPKDRDGQYPYIARATLCYFPKCRREQGVDYTDRELSLTFGKINEKGVICDINKNVQDDWNGYTTERKSRQDFRKWENTKFISSIFKNNRALKGFDDKFWGFCVTSKERTMTPKKEELSFGAVVTLREIKGVNRIEDFKHACLLRGYIVTELQVQNQIDIYEVSQQEVVFD